MKYKRYVALIYSNKITWITEVDNATKTFRYEEGKRAKVFTTKTSAENLVFGLIANGYPAGIVELPDFMEPANLNHEEN